MASINVVVQKIGKSQFYASVRDDHGEVVGAKGRTEDGAVTACRLEYEDWSDSKEHTYHVQRIK